MVDQNPPHTFSLRIISLFDKLKCDLAGETNRKSLEAMVRLLIRTLYRNITVVCECGLNNETMFIIMFFQVKSTGKESLQWGK